MDYKVFLTTSKGRWFVSISIIFLYIIIFVPTHMFLLGRTTVGLALFPVLAIGIIWGFRYSLLFGCAIFFINLVLSYFLDQNFLMNFEGLTGKNTFMVHISLVIIGGAVGKISDLNKNSQRAHDEIKELRGIIPICANCKKIRNDDGYWTHVEQYIEAHTDAKFSHSVCKECQDMLYGDQEWYENLKAEQKIKNI